MMYPLLPPKLILRWFKITHKYVLQNVIKYKFYSLSVKQYFVSQVLVT